MLESVRRGSRDWPLTKIILGAGPPVKSSLPAAPTQTTTDTNHWVIYLISPSTTTRLDPVPMGVGECSMVLLVSQPDAVDFESLTKTYTLEVKDGLYHGTVAHIMWIRGLDMYRFNASGSGCRFWAWTFLGVLKEEGVVISDIEDARNGLGKVWDEGGMLADEARQSGLDRGVFVDVCGRPV